MTTTQRRPQDTPMVPYDEDVEAVEDARHTMNRLRTLWDALTDIDQKATVLTQGWKPDERARLYAEQLGRYRTLMEACHRQIETWLTFKPY